MTLHLVTDDKFIDAGMALFRQVSPGHKVVVLGKTRAPLKHIKHTDTEFLTRREVWSPRFISRIAASKAVVFHGLSFEALAVLRLLTLLRYGGKIVWLGWGYDYYDLLEAEGFELYEPQTKARFGHLTASHPSMRKRLFDGLWRALGKAKRNAIRRFDYFAPVLEEDYEILVQALGPLGPQYVRWNYGLDFDAMQVKADPHSAPGNILVGNSATAANNHLEIFDLLRRAALGERKIVVPLNYGNAEYKNAIVDAGARALGHVFAPLTEFLPLQEFNAIAAQCTHAIMNHRRQQGAGTLFLALNNGARLFLNANSSLYRHLKRNGFVVNALSDIEDRPQLLCETLAEKDVTTNRMLLREHFGLATCLENTRRLVALMERD